MEARLARVEAALLGGAAHSSGPAAVDPSELPPAFERRVAALETALRTAMAGAPATLRDALTAGDAAAAEGLIALPGTAAGSVSAGAGSTVAAGAGSTVAGDGRGPYLDAALLTEAAPRLASAAQRWRAIDDAAVRLSAMSASLEGALAAVPQVAALAGRLAGAAAAAQSVRHDTELLLTAYSALVEGITSQTMTLDAVLPLGPTLPPPHA